MTFKEDIAEQDWIEMVQHYLTNKAQDLRKEDEGKTISNDQTFDDAMNLEFTKHKSSSGLEFRFNLPYKSTRTMLLSLVKDFEVASISVDNEPVRNGLTAKPRTRILKIADTIQSSPHKHLLVFFLIGTGVFGLYAEQKIRTIHSSAKKAEHGHGCA